MRDPESIVQHFKSSGLTVADWARSKGFRPAAVYSVLRGDTVGARGTSYRIAVALGMTKGQTKDIDSVDAWLKESDVPSSTD